MTRTVKKQRLTPLPTTHMYVWQRAVVKAKLPSPGLFIGMALMTYANPDGTRCFPTQPTIARDFNVSLRQVERGFQILRKTGFLAEGGRPWIFTIPSATDGVPRQPRTGDTVNSDGYTRPRTGTNTTTSDSGGKNSGGQPDERLPSSAPQSESIGELSLPAMKRSFPEGNIDHDLWVPRLDKICLDENFTAADIVLALSFWFWLESTKATGHGFILPADCDSPAGYLLKNDTIKRLVLAEKTYRREHPDYEREGE
jgi:hypothetical protein